GAQQRLVGVEAEAAVIGDRDHFQIYSGPVPQKLPGYDVGVVLHLGDHHLVARLQAAAVAVSYQVDRLGDVAGQANLVVGAGVEEPRHLVAHSLVPLCELLAEVVRAAVDVRVARTVDLIHGLQYGRRLLRRGATTEVNQRLTMDLLLEDREVAPYALDV